MSVYKHRHSPYYHYDFQFGGRRFYGSTEQTAEREARAFERRLKAQVKAGLAKPAAGGLTLDLAAGRYWDEKGKFGDNADELERNIERLVAALGPNTPIAAIDDEVLSRAIARRRAEPRWGRASAGLPAPGQVNRSFTDILRRILLRARDVWKAPLPDMPDWSKHRLAEAAEQVREVTLGEEDRIEAAEREDYRAIRQFALATGLRLRAALITWPQVDFAEGVLRVVEKGKQPRSIPITAEIRALLLAERGRHAVAVFTYVARRSTTNPRTGKRTVKGRRYPITYWGLSTRRRRDWSTAGVDKRWHDLRHTAAMDTLRATGNLAVVQKLLGHSRITTTTRYAKALMEDVAAGMASAAKLREERRSKSRKSPEVAAHGTKKRKRL